MSDDVIERRIEVAAPLDAVWAAITDSRQFGAWFRARIDTPFVLGASATGQMTYPGYEHFPFEATVVAIEPKTRFAFTWVPDAPNPEAMRAPNGRTLVEFLLSPTATGTAVTVRESGFAALPDGRGPAAMRGNAEGWTTQAENLRAYVAQPNG